MTRDRTAPLRRRGDRRRRRRAAGRDRGPARRQDDRRSSPSRCSARRTRSWPRAAPPRRWGTSTPNDNWHGPLPRHHARRQVPQQLPDGGAARQGSAGADLGAGDLRGALRPHQGRQDLAAQLRRPRVPAARARRRPHRPGAHPHPAAEDRLAAAGGLRRAPATTSPGSGSSPRPPSPSCCSTATAVAGAFGYYRETGEFVLFEAPAVVLATGGVGRSYKVTSNSWEYTGDGHALALRAGATLINMEFLQFHPTGMVWPPSVRGILVTESVRGDGGVLQQLRGQAVHVRLRPRRVPQAVRGDRGGGRPLVHRPGQQPPPAGAAAPRRGRPGHQHRGQGRPGHPGRRRLPRHRHPAAGRGTSASACRRCTTSSRSWPTSTSPSSRWRSARPATT